jgi:hypothetical protein
LFGIYMYNGAFTVVPSIHPYVAPQPLPDLGLPHKTPPFIPICSFTPPSSYPQQL